MRPIPINDAEGVIEAFWDLHLSDLAEYTFKPGQGTGAKASPGPWFWVEFSWHNATPGNPIFTMSRDVDITIEHYDALRIRCAVPSTAKLIFKAVVDGQEQVIVDGVIGPDKKWEYTGSIKGRHLRRLTIIYEAVKGGDGGGTLQWIGLVNRHLEKIRQSRSSPYTPDWPKFLKPAHEPVEAQPTLGLLFDNSELKAIRKKVQHRAFKTLMDELRAQAHELMKFEPEQYIMESCVTVSRHHRAHEIDRPWFRADHALLFCAFVGIIDNDPDMLRMAARCMLAMAHSQYWDSCFHEHFPGSAFDHAAFTASDYAYACALGLDWAGSLLTEAGREIILQAVSKKGMSLINKDFVQKEYIFHCNQAAHFTKGRIAGLLAMRSLWPRAQAWIEMAKKDMYESINLVFNANKDHGGREGPGYTSATAYNMLICLMLIARDEGKELKAVMPPELIGCSDFLLAFLSTAGRGDTVIPYGDTPQDGSYALDMVSLMALAGGDSRWHDFRNCMLSAPDEKVKFHATNLICFYTLIFTDSGDEAGMVKLPSFCLLSSTGMVESYREATDGPVRLQLIGGSVGGDHVHQDKGSFILEAFGDVLAIDRGKMSGNHPSENVLTKAHMHNVLTPAMMGEQEEEQELVLTEQPVLPCGTGDGQTLDIRIDTTPAWINKPFRKHVRRIYSPEPALFFIDDQVEFDRPRAATFHLHSSFRIEPTDGRFVVRGEHADLVVTPAWKVVDSRHAEDFVDGKMRPVSHLRLTSEPGINYHLVTILEVVKAGDKPRWIIESCGDGVSARCRSGEHTYEFTLP